MKNKKKIGIISTIVIILLAIVLFFIHINNNVTGTYEDSSSASLINLEPKGTGYFYEECVEAHANVPLTWKKIKGNQYQIQFNVNGTQFTFNASIKGNSLKTQSGVNWKARNFQKKKQSFNDLKQKLYNQYNISAKSIYNSNKTHYWLAYDSDSLESLIVTKNGKCKNYNVLRKELNNFNLNKCFGKNQNPQKLIKLYRKYGYKEPKWEKINNQSPFDPFYNLSNNSVHLSSGTYGYTGVKSNGNYYNFVLIIPNNNGKVMPTIHF